MDVPGLITTGLVDLRALDYVSSYDLHLMCPICHCPFVEPERLPCDHVFCQKCLRDTISSADLEDLDDFPCPSCRTPTGRMSTTAPRILINMCDEIRVRCPFISEGCQEIVPRGHIQSHVDKYCQYRLVACPDSSCDKSTRRKDLHPEQKCMHEHRRCSRCEEDVMEQDYEEHDKELCPSLEATCVDCETTVPARELKKHVETCPEVVSACTGSKYGCPVKVRRAEIAAHEQYCPLIAMGPYFEAQNSRLESLELTIRHLQQRNEIFEDGLAKLVESVRAAGGRSGGGSAVGSRRDEQAPSARPEDTFDENADPSSSVFSSNATTYLLSLHESLRDEVSQLSRAITDLDARASMTIMNECLRIKEDMAHTSAAVNSVRMQVQWLMSPRLHQGPRGVRANSTSNEPNRSQLSSSAPGPSNPSFELLRPRRPSDSGGTKL